MDCPSEEQLIRMKLGEIANILSLSFDFSNRKLEVMHNNDVQVILKSLDDLQLQTKLISSEPTEAEVVQASDASNKKLLMLVLAINLFFFVLEAITGFISHSMGLVADSLDMLADVLVYGMSLYVIDKAIGMKKRVATISGYFQMFLAVFGFIEVIRRFLGKGDVPVFETMIIISLLALIGNAISMYLLKKSKNTEPHMKASIIFTSNDVLVNIGVIIAGILVFLTNSKIPDLLIGTLVFFLVARGALKILKLGK
jgi:Co/Zn/Cd efflux system component